MGVDFSVNMNNACPANKRQDMTNNLTLVGVVASAGGIEATIALLKGIPSGVDAAFAVAQHMSPDQDSMLPTLLAHETALKVIQMEDGDEPERGTVHIIPPNFDAIYDGAVYRLLSPSSKARTPKPSGDRLLKSFADVMGQRAIGIVLSGTGSDGTSGLKLIHEAGGITLIQDPSTAKYDGMPVSAMCGAPIDFVLNPTEMGKRIIDILSRIERKLASIGSEALSSDADLFQILLAQKGVDFRDYKSATVQRRIDRRMIALGITQQEDYIDHCRKNPEEVDALYKDLLISVTQFFRDPEQFQSLRNVVQSAVKENPEKILRIWCAGVATGEEAYSLAMVYASALVAAGRPVAKSQIQIFGTDIDTEALEIARSGVYPASELAAIPADLASQFTSRRGEEIIMDRTLRSLVTFSEHNIFSDPPFVNQDLISARNILIYFKPNLQERVLRRLHYALNQSGMLFLGMSETAAILDALFVKASGNTRLYRKRLITSGLLTMLGSFSTTNLPSARRPSIGSPPRVTDEMFEALLKYLVPCGFITNQNGDISRVIGRMNQFFDISDLEDMTISTRLLFVTLRQEVTSILTVAARKLEVRRSRWLSHPNQSNIELQISVYPMTLPQTGENSFVVSFTERDAVGRIPVSTGKPEDTQAYIQILQSEIAAVKFELEQTVEELQTANEELHATNEEMQSTNEDLHIANQDLETANEELQSTNEELVTLNEESVTKAAQLSKVSSELHATFRNSPIAMFMVDQGLRVQLCSETGLALLGLSKLPTQGIHLSKCNNGAKTEPLLRMCAEALHTRGSLSQTVSSPEVVTKYFVVPYFADGDEVEGLSVSVVETETQHLSALTELMGRLGNVYDWMVDASSGAVYWSQGVYDIHGLPRKMGPTSIEDIFQHYHPDDRARVEAAVQQCIKNGSTLDFEARIVRHDGATAHVRALGMAIHDADRNVVLVVGAFCDLAHGITSEINTLQMDALDSQDTVSFFSCEIETDTVSVSPNFRKIFTTAKRKPASMRDLLNKISPYGVSDLLSSVLASQERGSDFDFDYLFPSDSNPTARVVGGLRRSPDGSITHVFGMASRVR